MKCYEKFKKDSKFAMLVLLGIALAVLILFAILVGFTIWFWIILLLWIVFFVRFNILFKLAFMSFILIVIAILVLSIALMVSGSIEKSGSKSSSTGGLVACTSTLSDAPTTIAGYKATMYAQPVESNTIADNGTRTFSMKALADKTGDDIFYRIEKTDGGFFPGVKGLIEVCNEDNKTEKWETTKDSTTTGASDTATAMIFYMHGNDKMEKPGKYRVDAYTDAGGSWKLVGRISDITITE
jgi:hypothetical protein